MPVIRNTRSFLVKTLTIKRFVAGEAIATNVYPFLWLGLNNTSIVDDAGVLVNHTGFKAGSSVIIRCEIATDAVGPICGVTGKARIVAESGYLKWYDNDNTLAYSVAIDGKIHDIGFVYDTNTTRPFYDGVINASMVYPTYERDLVIGGYTTNADNSGRTGTPISSSSSTYAIKVYEVAGIFDYYSSSVNEALTFGHFYACGASADATTGFMYDTRTDYASKMTPSGSGTKGLGALTQPYGVSLNDLQTAFGSAYEQLLAVIGQDNGVDRGGVGTEERHAGWLDPVATNEDKTVNADTAQVVVSDNQTLALAFYLQSAYLPAGATITNPGDVNDYEHGDLIRGRQPKWNLWQNNIGAFKYIKKTLVSGNYKYELKYNILKDNYGRNFSDYTPSTQGRQDQLAAFENYSNSVGLCYPPRIITPDIPVLLMFHADLAYDKTKNTAYNGVFYPYTQNAGATDIRAAVGNLPWWNLTATQQNAATITGDPNAQSLNVYGFALSLKQPDGGSMVEIAKFVSYVNSPFSADTDAATKTLYQQTGVSTQMTFNDLANMARLNLSETMKTKLTMSLLMAASANAPVLDCSAVCPSKLIDTRVNRYIDNLVVIGENDGQSYVGADAYDIYLQRGNTVVQYEETFTVSRAAESGSSVLTTRDAIGIDFAMFKHSNGASLDLFDSTYYEQRSPHLKYTPLYLMYGEFTMMRSWQSMVGAYDSEIDFNDYSADFTAVGNTGKFYIDVSKGEICHYVTSSSVFRSVPLIYINAESPTQPQHQSDYTQYVPEDTPADTFIQITVHNGNTNYHRLVYYNGSSFTYITTDVSHLSVKPSGAGTAGTAYRDASDTTILWVTVNYIPDETISVQSLPSTGAENITYTYNGKAWRWNKHYTGNDDKWIELPLWFRQGVMLRKWWGFATVFNEQDIVNASNDFFSNDTGQGMGNKIWGGGTKYAHNADAKTISPRWTGSGADKACNKQIGFCCFYYDNLTHGQELAFPRYKRTENAEGVMPYVCHYKAFRKSDAPHAWAPYQGAGGFSDQGEDWMFVTNNNYKYLVVGGQHLLTGTTNPLVADVWLSIYNNAGAEVTTFQAFKLVLYKQQPCEPYEKENGDYPTFPKDGFNYHYFPISGTDNGDIEYLGEVDVNALNSDYTIEGEDGINYVARITTGTHHGVTKALGSNIKYVEYDKECFYLSVNTASGYYGQPGVTYLVAIVPKD